MKWCLYFVFVFIFFLPSTAYAYLDPGTGNALVYVVMSFLGAMIFSLKGMFYALIGKKDEQDDQENLKQHKGNIVIFSEGKNYWNTFKPIVEALLKKKAMFSYYTMDIEDPCLTIDAPNMNNRYIGKGTRAFAKIGNLNANVVLSTTPNIGTEGYPIPRSKKIKKLVHVFHAFDDLTCYYRGSLDHYDAVLLVGGFEKTILRRLEAIRGLKEKELYPAGLPYLDTLAERKQREEKENDENKVSENKTVLIAPSWGRKGCLRQYGYHFIELLAQAGYTIIIRPHPQSVRVETELLDVVKFGLKKYENIEWDFNVDGTKSMRRAQVLISDTSSVRVDFLFLYQKPIITLEMPFENMQEYEMADLHESWKEMALAKMGDFVRAEDISRIVKIVDHVLKNRNKVDVQAFRNENVYNWGNSGEIIAAYLIENGQQYLKARGNV